MGGWGCPHEVKGLCDRVEQRNCEPGMKGCVLAGRFLFSEDEKNTKRAVREKGKQQGEE
ncbi:hypothetical protein [Candidatus Reidiella endopervernicosa]|uniref:Uncharacterized protein n=1 Tax=Candidatus Reidiella endopervernicosa TaxID=2738883 RepID=A0A6N0I0D9_9GAMM|nr:hypothetical protein [Candidatus Reidiella endopervernicosa]QKQ27941.1 hypothetical protein HUE57_17875 [Candidatus Reidiella endopervernicosa]